MSSKGRILKESDGLAEITGEEAKQIMSRLRTGQQEKFQKARRVRFIWPDLLVFIYDNNTSEIGRLHKGKM
jgi:hypothetical protein